MYPQKIEIYLYVENDEEARTAEKAAYDFVNDNYRLGHIVTAANFKDAQRKFKDNFFVTQFLRR